MRASLFPVLLLLCGPVAAQTAGPLMLPLREGRYFSGGCDRFNEAGGYFGVGVHKDGPQRGQQFVVPQAEGQQGYCTLRKLAPLGSVLSGVAECDSGTRTNPAPLGLYRFNFTVHGAMAFTSLGKRYEWCPATR